MKEIFFAKKKEKKKKERKKMKKRKITIKVRIKIFQENKKECNLKTINCQNLLLCKLAKVSSF